MLIGLYSLTCRRTNEAGDRRSPRSKLQHPTGTRLKKTKTCMNADYQKLNSFTASTKPIVKTLDLLHVEHPTTHKPPVQKRWVPSPRLPTRNALG